MAPARGRFVVLEGLDGAGTTTQTRLLGSYLDARKIPHIDTREPTDEPIGALIRQAIGGTLRDAGGEPLQLSEAALCLLFAADRLEHSRRIEAARDAGHTVLSDRYVFSSIAYQSTDPGISPMHVVEANRGIAVPDLTLFLHVPVSVCLERLKARGDSRAIYEERDTLDAIHGNYESNRTLYERHFGPVVHIDGTLPEADVHEAIVASVEELFGG